ncbi:MAG: hypothetical protein DMG57_19040 [Acidobacteria bacterium]|nr:MAG: hypothetical protein DMG57_19040 [Acidobacteriota bacterium]
MATALLQNFRFQLPELHAPEVLPSGIAAFDRAFDGIPRGVVTDLYGPASSGRTSLAFAFMAQATAREEFCVLVDASDVFDPESAAKAGVALERLLWIRCRGNTEHALQATDLVLQAGGFGVVVMDLGDVAPETARRISLASWYRLRRAIEHTPTALVVVERSPLARPSAALAVEFTHSRIAWTGAPGCSLLLRGMEFHAERRKPLRPAAANFETPALR